jgi:hypothetical protein
MNLLDWESFLLRESNSDELFPFSISPALRSILSDIDDDISEHIFSLDDTAQMSKFSALDTDMEEDFVTFIPSNIARRNFLVGADETQLKRSAIFGAINKSDPNYNKGRLKISIGRLVKKLFGSTYTDRQIEIFVNKFKSKNTKLEKKFELRNLVVSSYDTKDYSTRYGTQNPLYNSCMNNEFKILEFYLHNDRVVEVLVLYEESIDEKGKQKKKILGRALVWTLKSGEKFMDRVYYILDTDYYLFINWAIKNNVIHKSENKSGPITPLMKNNVVLKDLQIEVELKYPVESYDLLPYMDTLLYGQDNLLTNSLDKLNDDVYYELIGTDGDDFEIRYF